MNVMHVMLLKTHPIIVVRASDTGICILLFHFASQLDAQIWMDTGSSKLHASMGTVRECMAAVP